MIKRIFFVRWACLLFTLTAMAALGGCATYAVPGKGANFHSMGLSADRASQTDFSVAGAMEKKALASFPATIAVTRVQGPDYTARTVQLYGSGKYCVVLTHDVEKPEQFERVSKLPLIAQLEPVSRLELPETLDSESDLRSAAAALHADMVLIYTFDDTFDDRDLAKAATLLTLGIAPSKYLTVTCTASAVLMDVRNGYIYGAMDETDQRKTIANCWGEDAAADALREQTEAGAFDKMVDDFCKTWPKITAQFAPAAATQPAATRP